MFDGLFQEDGDDSSQNHSQSTISGTGSGSSSSDNSPLPPRLMSGFVGIYNQGATCYMNSLLQSLCMTPEFRERLFQLTSNDLGTLKDKDKKNAKVRVIPIQLQRLFARMLLLNAQGVGTTELTDSFGWTNNEELVQHDVQELNRILFSAVEDSLIGTPGGSLIRDLYHGSVVNQITCLNCGRISEREEDFLDLCVTVSGSPGLESSLRQSYVETEALDGKNQYRCENCGKLVDAKKGAKLRHLPPILTVSLLRFSFDFRKMERIKETGKFLFPKEMDMANYVENLSSAGCTEYELFSVVIHSGGAHGGHYTAYIRDIDSLGNWIHPDRDDIQLAPDPASGQVDFIECDSPVDLVQTILGRQTGGGMKVDNLCAELMKQTGISWNKRFKKQHGAINKFLKKHDDKFDIGPDNFVTVKQNKSSNDEVSNGISTQTAENGNCSPIRKRKTPKRPLSPDPDPGQAWFYFNDNRVTAVRTKELDSQYSGKSSAYMLFYRNKSLVRPPEACQKRDYMIPDSILEELCEENAKLEDLRKQHELKMNTVVVKLLFPSFYVFQQGALQAKDETFSAVELSIDRRKTVTDLTQAVREMYEELCPADIVIHTAKLHAAGVHLYSRLSGNPESTLQELGVSDRVRLFVWDGHQVGGESIPVGPDKEPVLLTVTPGEGSEFSHGFPLSLTLGELRIMTCEMSQTDVDGAVLTRVATEGENKKMWKLLPEDYGKTLEEAGIRNGDQIVLENGTNVVSSGAAEKSLQQQSSVVSFIVESRCGTRTDTDWPIIRVEVDRESTVEDLKAVALSRLSCESDLDKECRLRCDHDSLGLMPPLHEAQDVTTAGLKSGMRLVLEPGAVPLNDQMTLIVTPPGTAQGSSENVEIIVERSMTVADCLQLVVKTCSRTGDDWHLRKTNWCGEAADILDDTALSLAECTLKNGDHILLEEGQLPPRGFVKLHILLYPSPNDDQSEERAGILMSLLGGLQDLLGYSTPGESTPASPVDAGNLVISRDATLEELKAMILTLPKLAGLTLPSMAHLRLRVVTCNRLTAVLKNHQTSLLRLKLTNSTILGAQVLSQEEDLNQNQLLLSLLRRSPTTKTYPAPRELVWDTAEGATQPSLLSAVATTMGVPEERLVIAKHFRDKYEWHVVMDKPKKQNKGKKTQKSKKPTQPPKVSIRQSPFFIREGDDIGVKDSEEDPLNQDDFTTDYDLEGKERLRLEAEERKKRREAAKQFQAEIKCMTVKPRREVGIKIHVENFR